MTAVTIRKAEDADWSAIWPIVEAVVRAGETYTYRRDLTEAAARSLWMLAPPGVTLVATDGSQVLGSAKVGPNQMGPGAHMATASFMVDPAARGRGIGRSLGLAALDWARRRGFRAMQFNAVVEANIGAIALWRSLGFEIVGTIPEAFDHPTKNLISLHVMHRKL